MRTEQTRNVLMQKTVFYRPESTSFQNFQAQCCSILSLSICGCRVEQTYNRGFKCMACITDLQMWTPKEWLVEFQGQKAMWPTLPVMTSGQELNRLQIERLRQSDDGEFALGLGAKPCLPKKSDLCIKPEILHAGQRRLWSDVCCGITQGLCPAILAWGWARGHGFVIQRLQTAEHR